MIQDEYIKFETAKLLKEKGFDEKCGYCYAFFDEDDIRVLELKHSISGLSLVENRYPYVTQSVAMKWLREVHGIIVEILHMDEKPINAGWFFGYQKDFDSIAILVEEQDSFSSYEEACEEAIKYCLENLI